MVVVVVLVFVVVVVFALVTVFAPVVVTPSIRSTPSPTETISTSASSSRRLVMRSPTHGWNPSVPQTNRSDSRMFP
ncbi:hypothetical protein [Halorubrum sp. BOL3-1]|uniref:hypothetical protein n=1 Tax=Halorubrum sp. BOL3-1 TaxID=2497325 RepID=UPI00140C3BB8|nr:hypothetical protein [Halorubrum sp. BOL3-1]